MHVQVLGSGSEGNSLLVRVGETHVLVDAGLPLPALEERLDAARVAPTRIDHVVLTHGHLDHARAAGALSRKARARVHCPESTMRNASLRRAHAFATLPVGGCAELTDARGHDALRITTVLVPHDAHPTVALRLEAGGRVCVHVTDMGREDARVAQRLGAAHVLLLEFNHDATLLRNGTDPPRLKRRIAGDSGHLSNEQAAAMLRRMVTPQLHTLVLTHLSRRNNTPELARAAACATLAELGRADVQVVVAEQHTIGPNLEV